MLISVVMTAYNEQLDIIDKAVKSILNQTYKEFEFIIVLDNPDNITLYNYLCKIANLDKRVIFIKNEKNLGQSKSANIGIKQASGKYIARMDSDDISYENRLERELFFIEKLGVDMVFSEFEFIDEHGLLLKKSMSVPSEPNKVKKILKYKNIITQSTVMIKRDKLDYIGLYSNLEASEDYELWIRMIKNNLIIFGIKERLVKYRIRTESVTTSDYYKTFLADRFIKRKLLTSKKKMSLDDINREIQLFKNKNIKIKSRENFNFNAKLYFSIISNWGSISYYKYFKLIKVLINEPKLSIVFFNTLASNILRKVGE